MLHNQSYCIGYVKILVYYTSMSKTFSYRLESWLKSSGTKNLEDLDKIFGEKSFALAFLLLMSPAALPLPTGGITHIFEVITVLIALELVIGRHSIWLPKRWKKISLGPLAQKKVMPFIINRIQWFEKFSRPRLKNLADHPFYRSALGVVIIVLTAFAFFAPPFSGLDTLPALGVLIISLSILLEDIVLMIVGLIIGTLGVSLILSLGAIITNLISRWLA